MNSQILSMIIELAGGVGLFLFGMKMMGIGLESAAGPNLRKMIEKLTTNKYLGALVGLVVTALIQSSAATTVMVIGFVNAELMTLTQAVGVIMGANIGTTVTGLIIAINLTELAPIFVFAGVIMIVFLKKNMVKHIGQIIAGFGILFMGMNIMSTAMKPLSEMPEFTEIMSNLSNPLLGIIVGIVFTALVQSSSASVGVLQALGAAGIIALPQAVFVIYGQNIGSCVTALLSCIGSSKAAKRSAIAHLVFNIIGTCLFVIITLTLPFTQLMESIAPNNPMLQISLTHTLFNVICTVIMLPMSNILITIACKIIPGKDEKKESKTLMYLDERVFNTPPMAVTLVFKEVERMGLLAQKNYKKSVDSLLTYDANAIASINETEEIIDFLNTGISDYLTKINELDISDVDIIRISGIYKVLSDIERIGDHSENIGEILQIMVDKNKRFSPEAVRDITDLSNRVYDIVKRSLLLFSRGAKNIDEIRRVGRMEESIDVMTEAMKERHIKRLRSGNCSAVASTAFMDLLTNLERIADHANNISFSLIREQSRSFKIAQSNTINK